jgi:hypothetical protein
MQKFLGKIIFAVSQVEYALISRITDLFLVIFSQLFSIILQENLFFCFFSTGVCGERRENFQVIAGFVLVLLLQIMCKNFERFSVFALESKETEKIML